MDNPTTTISTIKHSILITIHTHTLHKKLEEGNELKLLILNNFKAMPNLAELFYYFCNFHYIIHMPLDLSNYTYLYCNLYQRVVGIINFYAY